MNDSLQSAIRELTDIQKEAVNFTDGALLVLAGPGSGKTQVLTCRIGRLLAESINMNFRVLALTFTNKAADEMMNRVRAFVPGQEERANVGTFHSFCAQVLRQHGVHVGIQPNFTIYSRDEDRHAVLADSLKGHVDLENEDADGSAKFLTMIDKLKSHLLGPNQAETALKNFPDSKRIAEVYRLYELELRKVNALDFNSLIYEAYQLFKQFPAIATRYRKSHPYWLLDEFQDTNSAQYLFIRTLAGTDFRNVFVVADDDQIIYQWNGASFRHIQKFIADFSSKQIQLPTNYRCPPAIVDAANHLVAYNAERTAQKAPLIAGKQNLLLPSDQHLMLKVFNDEQSEADGVAEIINERGTGSWGQTAVLARNRALLQKVKASLQSHNIPSTISQRRDDFLSPNFRWLVALLQQSLRPQDKRNMLILIEAFNRLSNTSIQTDQVVAEADVLGISYLAHWYRTASDLELESPNKGFLELAGPLVGSAASFREVAKKLTSAFEKGIGEDQAESDLSEDLAAWREIQREISSSVGKNILLDQFLQELQLRSKEPTPALETVRLMTIHGAKGREFDFVFVIGLAEEVMPSYQSLKKGENSAELEEERRNCFVAITRTKECLVLTRATSYRGYIKNPSRFLREMGLV